MGFTIACDVDGVVADLYPEWLRWYNADYRDTLTPDDITCWDIAQIVKPECGTRIYSYLNSPNLYEQVQPVDGALAGVQALRDAGHRVIFVTATNVFMAGQKLRWLERHGFLELRFGTTIRDYVETQDKSIIRADVMIDDSPENLRAFAGGRILFAAPHNRECAVGGRSEDWTETVQHVRFLTTMAPLISGGWRPALGPPPLAKGNEGLLESVRVPAHLLGSPSERQQTEIEHLRRQAQYDAALLKVQIGIGRALGFPESQDASNGN